MTIYQCIKIVFSPFRRVAIPFFLIFTFIYLLNFQVEARPKSDSEIGFPFIQTFLSEDYNTVVQTWAIAQTSNGLIYVGNNEGLFEYDGVSWKSIDAIENSVVRSLSIDSMTDRIYIGLIGDFGYLERGADGQYKYVSLKQNLLESDRDFKDVWSTLYTSEGVYFFTQKKLFLVKNDNIIHWESGSTFHRFFVVENRIFIRERDKGLLELVDGKLEMVNQGEEFAKDGINFIVDWPIAGEGSILLSSNARGMVIYDGSSFRDWPVSAQKQIGLPYTALKLADGRLIIGTVQSGIFILSDKGKLLSHISQASGLPDNVIYALKTDHEGGLWVGTDRGVLRLEINNPLTLFDERLGLKGQVLAINRFNNTLFVATSNGLFRLENHKRAIFKQVDDISHLTFDLLPFQDRLIIANHLGVFQLKENKVTRLLKQDSETAFALKRRINKENQIIVGDRRGLAFMELVNDKWVEYRIPSIDLQVREILMVSESIIWIGTNNNGVIKLTIPLNWPNDGPPTIEKYDESNGLPVMSGIKPFILNNEVRFSMDTGVFLFDEHTNQFVLDPVIENISEVENFQISQIHKISDDNYWVFAYKKANDKTNSYFGLIKNEQEELTWSNSHFSALNGQRINSIFIDSKEALWLGNELGLYHYDLDPTLTSDVAFNAHIQSVATTDDEVIYNGFGDVKRTPLFYHQNSLKFKFSATSFNDPDKTQFQVKLVGFDSQWSSWTTNTSAVYSELWEGDYRFKVKAKNRNGIISETVHYEFEISPPWYRSLLSYLLYFLVLTSLVVILVRVSSLKRRENLVLEDDKVEYELKELEVEEQTLEASEKPKLKRLKLQIGAKIWFVPIDDIVCLLAYGRYVKILTPAREGLIRMPLKSLFERLDADNFWQIHRSTIININYLDFVGNADSDRMTVNMKGIKEPFQISKSYSHQFRSTN